MGRPKGDGRPAKLTPAMQDLLVDGLTDGIPLRELCRTHDISKSSVYDWIEADESFAGRIARARERGFDQIAESVLEIADDGTNDYMERKAKGAAGEAGEAERVYDAEHVQRSKLRVEARLKLLAKWDPKRYGDKVDVTSGGKSIEPSMVSPVFNVTVAK